MNEHCAFVLEQALHTGGLDEARALDGLRQAVEQRASGTAAGAPGRETGAAGHNGDTGGGEVHAADPHKRVRRAPEKFEVIEAPGSRKRQAVGKRGGA
eukprot:scaffold12252_cov93-Isochrysis_galbana.AAC.1